MNHEIDLKKYDIHTDLVLDTIENNEFDIKSDIYNIDDIRVTKVNIDEENSRMINKKVGNYITIEFDDVTDSGNREKVTEVFSDELNKILSNYDRKSVLVVGLGNEKSTPDSLGPNVIDDILVTRHLFLLGEDVDKDTLMVSKISPGVMANTGIETYDIITSLVSKIKPKFLIAIDSLASSSIDRINRTIQLTDTGIHPGSGVGNKRCELSKDTIGVPVIAIGVPTVCDAVTIVNDTIDKIHNHFAITTENVNNPTFKLMPINEINKFKAKK